MQCGQEGAERTATEGLVGAHGFVGVEGGETVFLRHALGLVAEDDRRRCAIGRGPGSPPWQAGWWPPPRRRAVLRAPIAGSPTGTVAHRRAGCRAWLGRHW